MRAAVTTAAFLLRASLFKPSRAKDANRKECDSTLGEHSSFHHSQQVTHWSFEFRNQSIKWCHGSAKMKSDTLAQNSDGGMLRHRLSLAEQYIASLIVVRLKQTFSLSDNLSK